MVLNVLPSVQALKAEISAIKKSGGSSHPGLVFDRFFAGYSHNFAEVKQADKDDWFRILAGDSGKVVGNTQQIERMRDNRIRMVEALEGGGDVYSLDWNFVSGTGQEHPTENGFTWHPVLGTPYIPGSSVKGFLRAFCEQWTDDVTPAQILRWFGPAKSDEKDSNGTGEFIFFDVLPIEPTTIIADVITPHMGDWYASGDVKPGTSQTTPGDWHTPIPITFLAVSKANFLFTIAPRTKAVKEDLPLIKDLMERALAFYGIGAKTATGYGHFSVLPEEDSKSYSQLKSKIVESWRKK